MLAGSGGGERAAGRVRVRDRGAAVLLLGQVGGFPFQVADEVVAMDRRVVTGPATRPSSEPEKERAVRVARWEVER